MIKGIAFFFGSFIFVFKGEKAPFKPFLSKFVFFFEKKKEKKWVNSSAGP